jgi:hypothetical protein
MASEDSSHSSLPSAADTSVGSDPSATGDEHPPFSEVVDGGGGKEGEVKAAALKDLGNTQLLAGHFLQAIGFYSDALEFAPTNAIILSNRAQAYIKVENYGLAMLDATAAIESDASYAKAYYRRGSAQYALTHFKDARKDFRKVCQLKPKDRDARSKLQGCEKVIKHDAFLKAIESEKTAPLSATFDPTKIAITAYDGPNPVADGPTSDMDLEASLFEPGNLPRDFVMVSEPRIVSRYRLLFCFSGEFTNFLFSSFTGCCGMLQRPKAYPQTLRGSLVVVLQKLSRDPPHPHRAFRSYRGSRARYFCRPSHHRMW